MFLLAGQVLLIYLQQLLDGDQYGLAYVSQFLGSDTLIVIYSFADRCTLMVLKWSLVGGWVACIHHPIPFVGDPLPLPLQNNIMLHDSQWSLLKLASLRTPLPVQWSQFHSARSATLSCSAYSLLVGRWITLCPSPYNTWAL